MRNSKFEPVRFSRVAIVERLNSQIDALQEKWRFDPNNGTSQLRRRHPTEYEAACVAYGRIQALKWVRDEIA